MLEDEKLRYESHCEKGEGEGDAVVPNHEIGFGSGLCGGVRHIVCRCAFRGFRGGSVVDFGLGQLF